MARVTVNINQAGMQSLLQPGGQVYAQGLRIGAAITSVAKGLAPVGTGRLRQQIDFELIERPSKLIVRINSPVKHSLVVHQGHGPIYPRRARVLAWQRGGKWNYARRTRAVQGKPFLTEAVFLVVGKYPRGGVR